MKYLIGHLAQLQTGIVSAESSSALKAEQADKEGKYDKATLLSGALAVGSVISSMQAGKADSDAHRLNARSLETQATEIQNAGKEEAIALQDEFRRMQGAAKASLASSGIGGGSTASQTIETIEEAGEREMASVKSNTRKRALNAKIEAENERAKARSARGTSRTQALGTLTKFGSQVMKRGA